MQDLSKSIEDFLVSRLEVGPDALTEIMLARRASNEAPDSEALELTVALLEKVMLGTKLERLSQRPVEKSARQLDAWPSSL